MQSWGRTGDLPDGVSEELRFGRTLCHSEGALLTNDWEPVTLQRAPIRRLYLTQLLGSSELRTTYIHFYTVDGQTRLRRHPLGAM